MFSGSKVVTLLEYLWSTDTNHGYYVTCC